MEFRPCIDIHNGCIKQIVGGSLKDAGNQAVENFVSEKDGAYFANLYKNKKLSGGHIILLNSKDSDYYEASKRQAILALNAYPKGLQVGGGINLDNALEFLDEGASHVIVTSYVFKDGKIYFDRLEKLVNKVGSNRLVLDLSCRLIKNKYKIVTDRWQKITDETLDEKLLDTLSDYCDEFLIHAVDVEGKAQGIEKELVNMLGLWGKKKITYAGGVHNYEDIELIKKYGKGMVNVTIGSALDTFGGKMELDKVIKLINSPMP